MLGHQLPKMVFLNTTTSLGKQLLNILVHDLRVGVLLWSKSMQLQAAGSPTVLRISSPPAALSSYVCSCSTMSLLYASLCICVTTAAHKRHSGTQAAHSSAMQRGHHDFAAAAAAGSGLRQKIGLLLAWVLQSSSHSMQRQLQQLSLTHTV
jgi:hypothetical protein